MCSSGTHLVVVGHRSVPAALHEHLGLIQPGVGQQCCPAVSDIEEMLDSPHEGGLIPSRGVYVKAAQGHVVLFLLGLQHSTYITVKLSEKKSFENQDLGFPHLSFIDQSAVWSYIFGCNLLLQIVSQLLIH